MKFISLGIIDRRIWITFFGSIITLAYVFGMEYIPKYDILNLNPFLLYMYVALGMILAFIPFLIIKYKSKRENKIYNEQIIKSELYKQLKDNKDVIKKMKFKKYRFILYSAILSLSPKLLRALIYSTNFIYNLSFFDIIIMSLFSFLILKIKYYKHQFISMIIIVISGFGFNLIEYFEYNNTEYVLNFLVIFIEFISEVCFCLKVVIWKYNMEKNYCDPYELCFLEGIFEFISDMNYQYMILNILII